VKNIIASLTLCHQKLTWNQQHGWQTTLAESVTPAIERDVAEMKILIVEDGTTLGLLVSATLSDAGYEVIGPAETAATAMDLITSYTPDAALLDVTLKYGTSLPLAELLISLEIPIAFVTGRESDDLPDHMRDVPLLRKPFGADGLLTMVEALTVPYTAANNAGPSERSTRRTPAPSTAAG
jgi:DNA-binding response OmpR family regulator